MESAARIATLPQAAITSDNGASSWRRTVAVIRIPRFTLLAGDRREGSLPDDPLAAFATETELKPRGAARK